MQRLRCKGDIGSRLQLQEVANEYMVILGQQEAFLEIESEETLVVIFR